MLPRVPKRFSIHHEDKLFLIVRWQEVSSGVATDSEACKPQTLNLHCTPFLEKVLDPVPWDVGFQIPVSTRYKVRLAAL